MSMISWHTNKQVIVEGVVFRIWFVAMKQGVEAMHGIRYKLRMMGVEFTGPICIYGDITSMIHNPSKPEPVLKNNSNSIGYHSLREVVATEECLTTLISRLDNGADLLTKFYPERRDTT